MEVVLNALLNVPLHLFPGLMFGGNEGKVVTRLGVERGRENDADGIQVVRPGNEAHQREALKVPEVVGGEVAAPSFILCRRNMERIGWREIGFVLAGTWPSEGLGVLSSTTWLARKALTEALSVGGFAVVMRPSRTAFKV